VTTTAETDRLDPAVLKLALILVLGAMAPLLDSTIVSVAVHTLGTELHAPVSTVQWVSTAYLLALAMAVPITGWASARFGAKRMWLVALTLFLIGSVLCGLAWDIGSLIAFRVVQGIGGGLMLPILQTLLLRAANGRRIGRLMAVITLPAMIGPILGPVVGGLLLGHLDWRWIFGVNIPVCAVAIVLAWRGLEPDQGSAKSALDIKGLLLISPALAGIIYGLTQVGDHGFGQAAVLAPLVAGVVLLATFVVRALRVRQPLIDVRLFEVRSFAASSALMFLTGFALFGVMLILPLYFQQARGESVISAGLLLAPQGLGSLLARPAGSLADRFGARPVIVAGIIFAALGTVPFAFTHAGYLLLAPALVLRGAGLSAVNLAVMVGAFRDLQPAQIPHGSSTTRIMQQLGGSFGAAALAVILQAAGYSDAFWWAIGFTIVAVIPALALPRATAPKESTSPRTPDRRTP
jgi:EmrB/QacA subfamily drug resistance transporter